MKTFWIYLLLGKYPGLGACTAQKFWVRPAGYHQYYLKIIIQPLNFHYATTLGKTSTVEVFPFLICNSLHKPAMATNPDTLVLIICMMAFLIGPCLFICLYSTTYVIDIILQYSFPDHQPPFKLGPETLVGCPDGLCYLPLFRRDCHDWVVRQIGHFPSIYALSTVSTCYKRQMAKGT